MMMNDKNSDPIIEIFSGNSWESEMVKSLLESAEIQSFLSNSTLGRYAYEPLFSTGVKVMILQSDYEEAKKITEEYLKNINLKDGET